MVLSFFLSFFLYLFLSFCIHVCLCYSILRSKYINKCYYVKPSVYKYLQLFKSTNEIDLIKLSVYVKHALQMRADAVYIER